MEVARTPISELLYYKKDTQDEKLLAELSAATLAFKENIAAYANAASPQGNFKDLKMRLSSRCTFRQVVSARSRGPADAPSCGFGEARVVFCMRAALEKHNFLHAQCRRLNVYAPGMPPGGLPVGAVSTLDEGAPGPWRCSTLALSLELPPPTPWSSAGVPPTLW